MPAYRVVNKRHERAQVQEDSGVDVRGNAYTVRNPAPAIRFEVGALIPDLTEAELVAFPDRFVAVDEPPARQESGRQQR